MSTVTSAGTRAGSVSQTTETHTLGAGIPAGSLCVLGLIGNSAAADWTGVTDTRSNTWSPGTFVGGNSAACKLFFSVLTTALQTSDTVVATSASARFTGMMLYYATGPSGTSSTVLDKESTAVASVGSTTFDSGATATTSQASELVFGIACQGSSTSWTKGASFAGNITVATVGTVRAGLLEYKEVSSTGTYNADGTFGASAAWIAGVATFKLAPPGVAAPLGAFDPDLNKQMWF